MQLILYARCNYERGPSSLHDPSCLPEIGLVQKLDQVLYLLREQSKETSVIRVELSSLTADVKELQESRDQVYRTDPACYVQVVNEFTTDSYFTCHFPTLFPTGAADFSCQGRQNQVTIFNKHITTMHI